MTTIKKPFLRFLWVWLFLFSAIMAFAQKGFEVKGTVLDNEGNPAIGAAVQDLSNGAASIVDFEGHFSLVASSSTAELTISSLGMNTQVIPLNGRAQLTITLSVSEDFLEEAVVTALGIKRSDRALGYAVAEVKGDDVNAGHDNNLMSALSGKVAGVDISGTGGGVGESSRVIIRGNTQLSGSNMPLYVIDGVPIDNTQMGDAGQWGGNDMGDGVSSLSPENIESVSVLKGASAAALYGSRASNGVVLITTKAGKKGQGLGIDFSTNLSVVSVLSQFDDYQRVYGSGRNGQPAMNRDDAAGTTMSAWGGRLDPNINVLSYDGTYKPYGNVDDNILSFFRTGSSRNYNLALSNGNDKTTLRASMSHTTIEDIVPSSEASRTTFTLRGSTELGKSMGVEGRVEYTVEKVSNRPGLSDDPSNIGNAILSIAPNIDQKWLANYADEYGRYLDWNGNNIYRVNPYWVINKMTNTTDRRRVIGFLRYWWDILPSLRFQVKGGTDFFHFEADQFQAVSTPTAPSGSMKLTHRNISENNYEAMLRFQKTFLENKLDVSAFVAGNIRSYTADRLINEGETQVLDGLHSISNYSLVHTPQHDLKRKQVNSIYGAVYLGWDEWAYIDFTLRNDVSSTLAPSHRSYIYPSVSGSLIFSKLFGIENGPLSFGKLRASWAKVGGDTDPYQLDLTYGLSNIIFQGTPLGLINSGSIPYRELKPTSTYSWEVGTDLRFFKGRIALDLGYYFSSTRDQILGLPVSASTGYSKAMINAGEIQNRGVEMLFSFIPVQTRDFTWEGNLNFSRNINLVKTLHEEVKEYQLAVARWANAYVYASEGQPYGVIVGPAFARNEDGEIIMNNGLPTYTQDVQVLGNGTYDFMVGLTQSFKYRNLSFRALFDLKWGADLYSMSARQYYSAGLSKETLAGRDGWYRSEEARKAANATEASWTPTGGFIGNDVKNIGTSDAPIWAPNDVIVNPETYWKSVANNTPEPFIYDASFIKLRELNLSYNVPSRLLEKSPVRAASVSVYGRNLFILYKSVRNIDPESNYSNGNGQGFEYGSLPSRRTFGVSLNIKF